MTFESEFEDNSNEIEGFTINPGNDEIIFDNTITSFDLKSN